MREGEVLLKNFKHNNMKKYEYQCYECKEIKFRWNPRWNPRWWEHTLGLCLRCKIKRLLIYIL